ncbi:GNAT family N-acetyltransferase [Alicyclobacillus fodiniaquatilis]|uniref:GNAT family N-acetyltransferase n=1 Tax=Alicyclobacillus fodiniaquatilis TaxID=1661150 RepID=A0ABW4JK09_9BACL
MVHDGITIRSERFEDFHEIAELNATTFNYSSGIGEVPLISVLRNRLTFDSELSVVAAYEGRIVGHALFTPQLVRVGGETLKAVILAPIAVHPEFQNRGIGSKLIEEGHIRAERKGYQFSLLVGHPSYYPRFGYLNKMFGQCCLQVQFDDLPTVSENVEERRVEQRDLKELRSMWELWFSDTDLALEPGDSILDWLSHGRRIQTSAIVIDGQLSGYIRYDITTPEKLITFLAKDAPSVNAICSYLKQKVIKSGTKSNGLMIPVHPNATPVTKLINFSFRPLVTTTPPSMIKILDGTNASIAAYCDAVSSQHCSPGCVIWPVEFDVLP